MKKVRTLIKLGGSTLQDPRTLGLVTEAISKLWNQGREVIVVHGGGPAINEELIRRGISWRFENGQRVTSPEMMEVIVSVLENQINFSLVSYFQNQGLNAVSFSGRNQLLQCKPSSEKLGLVGDVQYFDPQSVDETLCAAERVLPVLAPLGCDETGAAYNVNADFAAACMGQYLQADEVWFLTDQSGILDSAMQPISRANLEDLQALIDQNVVTGGMLTKVRACMRVLQSVGPAQKTTSRIVRILKAGDVLRLLENAPAIGTICEVGATAPIHELGY